MIRALPQRSPSQWGARVDYDTWTHHPKDGVTVHWPGETGELIPTLTDDTKVAGKLRAMERFHLDDRGWSGLGYHYVIDPRGTLWRARGEGSGAHNPGDSDRDGTPDNLDSYGVQVLVGANEVPTVAQLRTLSGVIVAAGGRAWPHGATRPTTCPGPWLTAWVERQGWNDFRMSASATTVEDTVPDREPRQWEVNARDWAADRGLVNPQADPLKQPTWAEVLNVIRKYDAQTSLPDPMETTDA